MVWSEYESIGIRMCQPPLNLWRSPKQATDGRNLIARAAPPINYFENYFILITFFRRERRKSLSGSFHGLQLYVSSPPIWVLTCGEQTLSPIIFQSLLSMQKVWLNCVTSTSELISLFSWATNLVSFLGMHANTDSKTKIKPAASICLHTFILKKNLACASRRWNRSIFWLLTLLPPDFAVVLSGMRSSRKSPGVFERFSCHIRLTWRLL